MKFTGSFTVEAWIYPLDWNTGVSQTKIIASKYDYDVAGSVGWYLGRSWNSNDGMQFIINNGTNPSTTNCWNKGNIDQLVGTWIHVAGVFSSGEYLYLYVNGEEICTDTIGIYSEFTDADGYDLVVGMRSDALTLDAFNGTIDEARISNTARLAGWIKTSFNNQDDPSSFLSISEQVSIPTMTEWGMIIFIVLAGFGSIYYLRRQRIKS